MAGSWPSVGTKMRSWLSIDPPSPVVAHFQVCRPRYLIDHGDRRVDIRRPTVAAIASHSLEKFYDPHNMFPYCSGKLRRVQYLHAIRRFKVMNSTHARDHGVQEGNG